MITEAEGIVKRKDSERKEKKNSPKRSSPAINFWSNFVVVRYGRFWASGYFMDEPKG